MADGTSAAERLERLLHILPAASVKGGVAIEALARELDVEPGTVLGDVTEVTSRSYYHPPGSGDDIQISIGSDRVSVWTTGPFQRPVKLSPVEAFCLALGLRRADPGDPGDSGDSDAALLGRIEAHLATADVPDEPLEGIRAPAAAPDPDGVRDVLVDGARTRRRCRISYLKPAGHPSGGPDDRVIHPYAVAHAEGRWYVVGWCEQAEGARAFRLDRILDAGTCAGGFEVRDRVDVESFLEGGRVYHADDETEVAVRYSPAVARWVREWAADVDELDDGGVLVRHRVADPRWVVRHVLAYGGEAEVVEPQEIRDRLARVLTQVEEPS